MKLTAQHVFDAAPIVAQIIREQRPMPQKGSYRLARLHKALAAEYATVCERRDALIVAYDHKVKVKDAAGNDTDQEISSVPADKAAEFFAAWKEIADEEIEVNVEPIPLVYIDLGDETAGSIRANELITLGELVCE